jgi:hypothetical protein
MSLSEIQLLLDDWRAAERALEGYDPDGAEFTARDEIVRDAREEFLETVRERAGRYRYASGPVRSRRTSRTWTRPRSDVRAQIAAHPSTARPPWTSVTATIGS